MHTVVIIQARINSTRLPGKTLLPLPTGRCVVEEVFERCTQIDNVADVIVAAPMTDKPFFEGLPINLYAPKGIDEADVLGRYAATAQALSTERIVRITADCPMLSADVVGQLIALAEREDADYASNSWPRRTYPKGYDCEVFGVEWLYLAARDAYLTPYDREHVTPHIQRNARRRSLLKSADDYSHINMSLDTIADYRRIWEAMASETD